MVAAANSSLAIWERVLVPEGELSADAARYLLQLDFTPADHARMAVLNDGAAEGTLTPEERNELADYVRVGHHLALLQSRARVRTGGRLAPRVGGHSRSE